MSDLSRMTLQIQVNRQHIVRLDKNIIVEKSKNYLYAHFTISDDWVGLNKYVLVRPYDINSPSKLTLDEKNTCKIPYDVILFPGFVISARGEDEFGEQVILGDGLGIDVELARIEDGDSELPIRYITSTGNTININKSNETANIDLEMSLLFNPNNSTLTLNAITHNTVDEHGEPITITTPLANAILNPSIQTIVAEDSHTEGGVTTYRNLVFTYTDGTTQRVSIDKFWNEIREQVNGLDIALNSLSDRVSAIEVDYLTSSDKTELEGEISEVSGDVEAETTRAETAEGNLSNRITAIENDYLTSSDKTELEESINSKASQSDLNAEIQNRQNADNALSGRIDNLENAGFITQDINTSSIGVQYTKSTSKVSLVSIHEWKNYDTITNKSISSCAYGNGYFVGVGQDGVIIYSQNGQEWTLLNLVFSATNIDKIVFGNGYFLAISYESKIIYKSYIPTTWSNYTTISNVDITNLLYINNKFVLTGTNGYIGFSENGKKFTQLNTNINKTINSVAYGNSVYVAVGEDGLILTSKDGEMWYNRSNNLFTEDYTNIIFYNGIFVAITNTKIRYSTNYYQFNTATTDDLTGFILTDLTVGESNYYVVGNNNVVSYILQSTNGQIFTTEESTPTIVNTIDYGNDNFVTLGSGNKIYNLDLSVDWSYTKPTINDNEYLWCRDVNNLNNGDVLYSSAYFMGFIDKDVNDLENYYDKPTTNDLLDGKQDDMVAIENTDINDLFN